MGKIFNFESFLSQKINFTIEIFIFTIELYHQVLFKLMIDLWLYNKDSLRIYLGWWNIMI
jgi:hypothetical protein